MQGEIHTLKQLENMDNWRATLRHVVSLGSPPRFVCLMKKQGKKQVGYLWKMPTKEHVEDANISTLQEALNNGRLVLVKGNLPPGIKAPAPFVVEKPKKRTAIVA